MVGRDWFLFISVLKVLCCPWWPGEKGRSILTEGRRSKPGRRDGSLVGDMGACFAFLVSLPCLLCLVLAAGVEVVLPAQRRSPLALVLARISTWSEVKMTELDCVDRTCLYIFCRLETSRRRIRRVAVDDGEV